MLVVIVLGFLRGNSNSKLAIGAIFFGLVGNLILGSDRLKSLHIFFFEIQRRSFVGKLRKRNLRPVECPRSYSLELNQQVIEGPGRGEVKVIEAKPQFEESYYATQHRLLPLTAARQVYLHPILQNVRVDPDEDLAVRPQKDHVFIEYETPVPLCQSNTGKQNSPRGTKSTLARTELPQSAQGISSQLISPQLQNACGELLSDDDARRSLDMRLLSEREGIELFLGAEMHPVANSIVLSHDYLSFHRQIKLVRSATASARSPRSGNSPPTLETSPRIRGCARTRGILDDGREPPREDSLNPSSRSRR